MKFYRLYAKFEGQNQFKALDLSSGTQVNNLIRATIFNQEEIQKVNEIIQENPEVKFKIVEIK